MEPGKYSVEKSSIWCLYRPLNKRGVLAKKTSEKVFKRKEENFMENAFTNFMIGIMMILESVLCLGFRFNVRLGFRFERKIDYVWSFLNIGSSSSLWISVSFMKEVCWSSDIILSLDEFLHRLLSGTMILKTEKYFGASRTVFCDKYFIFGKWSLYNQLKSGRSLFFVVLKLSSFYWILWRVHFKFLIKINKWVLNW